MRKFLWAVALAASALQASPLFARTSHHYSYDTATDAYYTNVAGHRIHRPTQAKSRPSGATAKCRDGSWSFSENHRGTCSHHGGVESWL